MEAAQPQAREIRGAQLLSAISGFSLMISSIGIVLALTVGCVSDDLTSFAFGICSAVAFPIASFISFYQHESLNSSEVQNYQSKNSICYIFAATGIITQVLCVVFYFRQPDDSDEDFDREYDCGARTIPFLFGGIFFGITGLILQYMSKIAFESDPNAIGWESQHLASLESQSQKNQQPESKPVQPTENESMLNSQYYQQLYQPFQNSQLHTGPSRMQAAPSTQSPLNYHSVA